MDENDKIVEKLREKLKDCEYVLVGIGSEWRKAKDSEAKAAYHALYELTDGKDYFIVTTVTDARIFDSPLRADRITAPCGNVNWFQCSEACTKDIWERGEVPEGRCPHCGAPLAANTIEAKNYIEEGYLKSWNLYREWLAGTLNHALLILELGVDFKTPTVIRWPFEKTAALNQKALLCRVHEKFYQLPDNLEGRGISIKTDSTGWMAAMEDIWH